MDVSTHEIVECRPGVYRTLLDFPSPDIVRNPVSPSHDWVLCWNHLVGDYRWRRYDLPVEGVEKNVEVFSREISYDLLMPSSEFLSLPEPIQGPMRLAQFDRFPPDWLDMRKLEGKRKHRVLDDLDWYFTCDIPAARDYAPIESVSRELVERAVSLVMDEDRTSIR